MRAATTLVPSLQAAGAMAHLWRGDEWMQAEHSPQEAGTSSGFPALDPELPGGGWPCGQLVELLVDKPGSGELSLLLPALAANSRAGRSCVWVLPASSSQAPGSTGGTDIAAGALPYAPALTEAGIDLSRNIFVRPLNAREGAWALEQSLRAAHLGALVGWLPDGGSGDADFRCLRRLHLLAQRHQALVFILRRAHHARSPSPAALRLHLEHDGSQLQVRILKRRGRPLLDPVALQIHPTRWNLKPVPVPAPAVPSTTASAPLAGTFLPGLLQKVQSLAPAQDWSLGTRLASTLAT